MKYLIDFQVDIFIYKTSQANKLKFSEGNSKYFYNIKEKIEDFCTFLYCYIFEVIPLSIYYWVYNLDAVITKFRLTDRRKPGISNNTNVNWLPVTRFLNFRELE